MAISPTILLLVASFVSIQVQEPAKDIGLQRAVFSSFHSSIEKLKQRFGAFSKSKRVEGQIASEVETIADNVKFLEAVTAKKETPKEYFESLALDAELLTRLVSSRAKTRAAKQALLKGLKDVADDLTVKVKDIADTRGTNEGRPRTIRVVVRAKKGAQDLTGYEVWYVLVGWRDEKQKWNRFDRLTSSSDPPAADLAPGRYVMWLTTAGSSTPHQVIRVGVEDTLPKPVDLVVP